MSYEYMLDFAVVNRSEADSVLRSIQGFVGFSAEYQLYSFRRETTGPMPDADAKVEASGIYVCHYGGSFGIVTDIQAAFAAIGHRAELREL